MKINKWLLPIIPLLIAFFFFGTTAIGDSREEAASMSTMGTSNHSGKDFNKNKFTANVQNSIKFLKEKKAQKLKEEEERFRIEQDRLEKEKIEQEKNQEEEQKRFEEEKRAANLKVEEKRKNQETDDQTKSEAVQEKKQTTTSKDYLNYPGFSFYESEIVKYTNIERANNGLSELKIDTKLSEIAWYKSRDMHEFDYFDHHSPTYGSPSEMMKSFGISYKAAAENIALGYDNAQDVVTAWMNSEGHRRNILNPIYTHIGVGNVPEAYLSTQIFIKK
ncbi:CAP domain-containing protein [Bacillaceae bacterium S4-13-56]